VVSFVAGILLLAGYTAAAAAAETSKGEAAIHAITQAWAKAYNAGDGKAVSSLYADQAVLLPPGAPAAKGKAAIQTFFARDTAESAKAGIMFSIDPKSDVGTAGNLAWESGIYTVKAKSSAPVDNGKFLTVYTKSGGKWLILRDIWNSDAAPAPASPALPSAASPAPPAPAKT